MGHSVPTQRGVGHGGLQLRTGRLALTRPRDGDLEGTVTVSGSFQGSRDRERELAHAVMEASKSQALQSAWAGWVARRLTGGWPPGSAGRRTGRAEGVIPGIVGQGGITRPRRDSRIRIANTRLPEFLVPVTTHGTCPYGHAGR